MRILGCVAAAFTLLGIANAAPIAVANGDFEDAYTPDESEAGIGEWAYSVPGWTLTGNRGGVWTPEYDNFFTSTPAETADQIAWVKNGTTLSQDLGVTIAGNTEYLLSALIGDRLDLNIGGVFGFYAGDLSNVILSASMDTADGEWVANELLATVSDLTDFVGLSLGIFFKTDFGRAHIDLVNVNSTTLAQQDVVATPIPAAMWMFGTVLLGGGFMSRRKKNA